MKVLKSILNESKEYYVNLEKEITRRLSKLPSGSIKKRKINGKIYYYIQQRVKNKIVHKYLGKSFPENIFKQLKEKKELAIELKKTKEAIKLLKKTERKKSD